jgi:hypothetical protein
VLTDNPSGCPYLYKNELLDELTLSPQAKNLPFFFIWIKRDVAHISQASYLTKMTNFKSNTQVIDITEKKH